ncbi:hypothetical protein Leryth_006879 [Lithospermum erythrorhizon]|uniref:Protease n=1 Tax=Lithospermum erythrorhizon TaxID=34254 RepID=A0AAV3RD62_LITER|nr:hypothetical protein Leryth_006879 [Lithospermum erythrorhizon]
MGCWRFSFQNPRAIIECNIPRTNQLPPSSVTLKSRSVSIFASSDNLIQTQDLTSKTSGYNVKFMALGACKLGISRYPNFEYNAQGGTGTGTAKKITSNDDMNEDEISVNFDIGTLFIPPLSSTTTKLLGLPLPPFLKIEIVPELFRGTINQESGKIELEFRAKFLFTAGNIYEAPPLLVETVLTSEESIGNIRSGRGERLDEDGRCRLVGVATVQPINDFFMNSFLSLPTECLADLNAIITFF